MRVNLGCGEAYLEGWVNVDVDPAVRADVHADGFDFVRSHGPEVSQMYLGHVLEHMVRDDALALLRLAVERLPAGAEVSAVTPDMKAVFAAYEAGEIDNRALNERFVFSYVQPSHHLWCYDPKSLLELFREAGFDGVEPVDPTVWPPVFHKAGPEARWQCGARGLVPATAPAGAAEEPEGVRELAPAVDEAAAEPPPTPEELLLARVERLRRELERASAEAAVARRAAQEAQKLKDRIELLEHDLRELRRSRTYQLATRLGRVSEAVAPKGSRKRRTLSLAVAAAREAGVAGVRLRRQWREATAGDQARGGPAYEDWCRDHDAGELALLLQTHAAVAPAHPYRVLVVVATPAGGHDLSATLQSLSDQTWPHWQAAVLPGAPGPPEEPGGDRRVVWHTGSVFEGGVDAVVAGAVGAELVLVLRAGDVLAPECLYQVATTALQDPLVDLVYWDDDRLDEQGRRHDPRFRPSWSPEALLGSNYIGSSFAMRRRRWLAAGGLRRAIGDGAEWDLLLRCDLGPEEVSRVPRVLAHLPHRQEGPGAGGVEIVSSHLRRKGLPARAGEGGHCVRVTWELERWPRVTVIIPTRHNRPMLSRCLPGLSATDYPSFEVIVVDNGGRTDDNEAWYVETFPGLDLRVDWWDSPFNYSAVNNRAASMATGSVLVFLNDDTEVLDPQWMRELVGWAVQPAIGAVGLHLLDPDGLLQFAGTVVGLGGFADHLFQGMEPGSGTTFGPTGSYRNVLAVTGACLAVRADVFESVGGFDERFVLCGSDVALGLDLVLAGYRNLCTPFSPMRHHESATRGPHVPQEDFYTSYWRYQAWLFGGDPYYSPNLSLASRQPELRGPSDKTVGELIGPVLDRRFEVFRQRNDAAEARGFADACRATEAEVRGIAALHRANARPFEPETVNWFIPDLDSPFYGGINTAFRIADHLARNHGVTNRFVVWGPGPERYVSSGMAAAFPALATSPVVLTDGSIRSSFELPPADVSIATLWVTAYQLAHFPDTRRKFYLIQDFEPSFHPAGTLYALAEESYRLGLYGLCNTPVMRRIYEEEYGGRGGEFLPAVDSTIFHAEGRRAPDGDAPVTVFVYARPGHWRNCWELAGLALAELKARLGDRVRIVAAGSWARSEGVDMDPVVKHLGLLDYRATGPLYRRCDVGLALTVSKHPSYLPLELMACGVPVVAFDSPHFKWLLRDGENCLLAERTADAVADALERLVVNPGLRRRLADRGLADIAGSHSSWDKALAGVYPFLTDPEGLG